jgi:hypothetical protein
VSGQLVSVSVEMLKPADQRPLEDGPFVQEADVDVVLVLDEERVVEVVFAVELVFDVDVEFEVDVLFEADDDLEIDLEVLVVTCRLAMSKF